MQKFRVILEITTTEDDTTETEIQNYVQELVDSRFDVGNVQVTESVKI